MMDTTEYFIRNKKIKECETYEILLIEGYKDFLLPSSIINIKKFSAYIGSSNLLTDNTKLPNNNLILTATAICKIEIESTENKSYIIEFTIPYNKLINFDTYKISKDNIYIENKVLKLLTRIISNNTIYFSILYKSFIHIV